MTTCPRHPCLLGEGEKEGGERGTESRIEGRLGNADGRA